MLDEHAPNLPRSGGIEVRGDSEGLIHGRPLGSTSASCVQLHARNLLAISNSKDECTTVGAPENMHTRLPRARPNLGVYTSRHCRRQLTAAKGEPSERRITVPSSLENASDKNTLHPFLKCAIMATCMTPPLASPAHNSN